MKTKLFLLGLVAALSFTSMQAQEKVYVKDAFKTKANVEVVKKQAFNSNLAMPMRLKAVLKADMPDGMAMVTLTAGDIWGDGSGYQMLLDADATAYGTIIPETGGLTTSGNASAATYAEFEYKIPENADGAMTTSNMVINNSISITIPAGTYDYCITNPTPGDRIWIASSNGTVPGRADDYVFQAGYNYVFTIGIYGSNDGVALTISVEGQALTTPENLTADPTATTAAIAWEDNDDMGWILRYRPYVDPANVSRLWDLPLDGYEDQLDGFLIYDADGDGNNWYLDYSSDSQDDVCFASDSWSRQTYASYDPDNWLITPEVGLGGTLKFKTWNRSSSWADMMAVYVCTNPDWQDVSEFELLQDNIVPGTTPEEYVIDLSAYEGTGVIAFRHYNSYDNMSIYLDDIEVIAPGAQEYAEWIYVNDLTDVYYTIEGLTPETEYEVQVQAVGAAGASNWTPSTRFITLAEGTQPTEKTDAPSSQKVNYVYNDGNMYYNAYTVTLIPAETAPNCDIYYRVGVMIDGEYVYGDWMLYTGELNFDDEGTYMVEAYAIAQGKTESDHIWDGFTVSKLVDVEEIMAGKTVANVRYFNVTGQEMAQPSGLTIQVTTYTDGTTSAVKVVK